MATIEVRSLPLPDCKLITVPRFTDERGDFAESWSEQGWRDAGVELRFVQDNHSRSRFGVLRGLHYQLPPFAQAKVVRVLRGSVFDVAVDLRRSSSTFGTSYGITLTADSGRQLLIPEGFAHGFLALEEGAELAYKVTAPFSRDHDRAIRFDDPDLAIDWPDVGRPPMLSDKDQNAPLFRDAELFA